jgi:protein TonB
MLSSIKISRMKTIVASIIFMMTFSFVSISSAQVLPEKSPSREDAFIIVENMPEYPGGKEALANYLISNIKYPKKAKEQKIEGTVVVTFIIDKTGKVKDAVIKKSENTIFNDEALRLIRSMPNWKPGMQGDVVVNVQLYLPVVFKLS